MGTVQPAKGGRGKVEIAGGQMSNTNSPATSAQKMTSMYTLEKQRATSLQEEENTWRILEPEIDNLLLEIIKQTSTMAWMRIFQQL